MSNSTLVFRTTFPYQAQQLTWCNDNYNLDEEKIYYLNTLETSTDWYLQNNK
ncbi:MAG: hypothetical protein HOF75_05705 [Flavobacteriaceae bacterium]|nr:hypothetical protein [Flavobacteriaceae bacterium]MBT3919767.1 hypothetical protein [Flavobacteriaceae bacterium]MBT6704539.1 hypothetical protein [Flavobacteriaceae bacterium]MBT7242749.1 hypothetical protein [Flavobacteriaceae bacterium]|tara:strand:- start:265 stop:420 length:156 start_codon:yes stop_codon:yes gene_type:complete